MKIAKYFFFVALFTVFVIGLVQDLFHLVPVRPLSGAFEKPRKPVLAFHNCMTGAYQDSLTNYIQKSLYISPCLIRLRNDIGFTFFNEMHVQGGEVGKNSYLFESGYIHAHYGIDFVGEEKILQKTQKIKFVQDELKKRGITFLFVIAPTKASYYPEYISDRYKSTIKKASNYDLYIKHFQRLKIDYLDLSEYFLKLKSHVKYPLFTRTGIHWSGYGATIAADTLFRKMEELKKIDIQDYYYEPGVLTSFARGTDNDLGVAMNLINQIPSFPMYYPNLKFKYYPPKVKPNVLIVGDSFVWSWIGFYNFFPELLDDKSAFWFYNRELAWTKTPEEIIFPLDSLALSNQTLKRDYIIIVNNRWALNQCGNGFVEQMYDLLNQ